MVQKTYITKLKWKYFYIIICICCILTQCHSVPQGEPTQDELKLILTHVFKREFDYSFKSQSRDPESVKILSLKINKSENNQGIYSYDLLLTVDADLAEIRAIGGSNSFPVQVGIKEDGSNLLLTYATSQRFPFGFNTQKQEVFNRRTGLIELKNQ